MKYDYSFGAEESGEFKAVVSTARHQVTATWLGKSYIFDPGVIDGKTACIQRLPADIAIKVQHNRRVFLEIMPESAGKALHALAVQEGSFFKAFKKATGEDFGLRTAAGTEAKKKAKLRDRLADECALHISDEEYADYTSVEIQELIQDPGSYRTGLAERIEKDLLKEQPVDNSVSDAESQFKSIAEKKAYRRALWEEAKRFELKVPKNISNKDLEYQVNLAQEIQDAEGEVI